MVAALEADDAQKVEASRMAGLPRKHLPVQFLGFLQSAKMMKPHSVAEELGQPTSVFGRGGAGISGHCGTTSTEGAGGRTGKLVGCSHLAGHISRRREYLDFGAHNPQIMPADFAIRAGSGGFPSGRARIRLLRRV